MEQLPVSPKPVVVVRDEMWLLRQSDELCRAVKAGEMEVPPRRAASAEDVLTQLARQGRSLGPVVLEPPVLEPAYFFCNSCGEEVEDEAAECCVDGEIEPSYEPAT